jgi:hypothetical protein
MKARTVAILFNHDLFARGLVGLLRRRGLAVTAIDARAGDAAARLRAHRPAVILVEDNDTDREFSQRLMGILAANANVGIIRISIQNNQLSLYSARQVTATGPQDLFNAIEQLLPGPEAKQLEQASLIGQG